MTDLDLTAIRAMAQTMDDADMGFELTYGKTVAYDGYRDAPDTILALCDEVERLRAQIAAMEQIDIPALADAAEWQRAENQRLRGVIAEVEKRGLRCDLNPTRPFIAGAEQVDAWWLDYLRRIDEAARDDARRALGGGA